jgi:hydrogenase maturation protein HypF
MSGVIIEVSGSADSLNRFAIRLRDHLPSGAAIAQVEDRSDVDHCESFRIESSHESGPTRTIVPTDKVVCEACLSEIQTPGDRRFAYPFTSCTDCGPRYSLLRSMPYDRERTSMSVFSMCGLCRAEYEDPQNRRFHSQTNCCPACGPRLWSTDPQGNHTCVGEDAMQATIATIRAGKIVAVKGIGGYQLICDATNEAAVALLRERKRRPSKPLAVMVRDLDEAEELAHLSGVERESLRSAAGPIVIARSKPSSILAQATIVTLSDVGVMLPTSPLHFVLLETAGVPLVVTSGNVDGEPIEFRESEAEKHLASVADRFLHHDREIVRPIDDSVVRCIADRAVTIRAARGIAPVPLEVNLDTTTTAVGGQQKVAIAISNGHQAVLGPHIGDLDCVASRERFKIRASPFASSTGALQA